MNGVCCSVFDVRGVLVCRLIALLCFVWRVLILVRCEYSCLVCLVFVVGCLRFVVWRLLIVVRDLLLSVWCVLLCTVVACSLLFCGL